MARADVMSSELRETLVGLCKELLRYRAEPEDAVHDSLSNYALGTEAGMRTAGARMAAWLLAYDLMELEDIENDLT